MHRKVNLEHCTFHALKDLETHCLMNALCLIAAQIAVACRYKTNIPSYLTVTSDGLFCLNFLGQEEPEV